MKYNPKVNEDAANLEGFTAIHPLAPEEDVQGCLEVVATLEKYLTQITGMDAFCFQPAAGAHGEFSGLMTIRNYLKRHHEDQRTVVFVPDSAHWNQSGQCGDGGLYGQADSKQRGRQRRCGSVAGDGG